MLQLSVAMPTGYNEAERPKIGDSAMAKKSADVKPRKTGSRSPAARAKAHAGGGSETLHGKKAPVVELMDAQGRPVVVPDLAAGKKLVLYFYPKDMTPGCTAEACSFRDRHDHIVSRGAVVVGISGDTPASHTKFESKYGLNFLLLSDVGNKAAKLYGVYKMKSMYGRQFMGIERTTFLIDRDGVVRRVFPKVKVNGHSDEVLAGLDELA